MPDELETILRLVAEGTLTPEEAAPIIDALTFAERRSSGHDRHAAHAARHAARVDRHLARAEARAEEAMARGAAAQRQTRQLRIRVTERGRQVVNLRIPIGFVDAALKMVPGIGGEQASRIRDAVRAGAVGPIIDVEDVDGEGGVLISVE
jgi:hypothetical protein